MNPTENSSSSSDHFVTHYSDSDFTSLKQEQSNGFSPYIPPLILPNGRPSLARTVSQLELSSRSNSPSSPQKKVNKSPEHSPLRPVFDKLPITDSSTLRKKIDRGCKKYIKVQFKLRNPTLINAALLASKVDIVARYEIEKHFKSSSRHPISNRELILYIQHSGILISNIQRKLQVLVEILECYGTLYRARTDLLCELRKSLVHLMSFSEELVKFSIALESYQKDRSKIGKLLWEIISLAIEDNQGKTDPILSILDRWTNPTEFEIELLNNHIDEVTLIQSIPGTEVDWVEGKSAMYPIDSIPAEDVVRSMFPSDQVIMNSITINGKPFFPSTETEAIDTQKKFFRVLLSELYQAGYAAKRERDVNRDLDTLLTATRFSSADLPAFLLNHPLPILDLLRPYTISCWGHADQLIRKHFPIIFNFPYCAKIKQGVDCAFSIKSPRSHSVTVSKTYQLYFRQDTLNQEAFPIPNPERMLCELVFEWTLSKKDAVWKGNLLIKEVTWNPVTPWEDQKAIATGIVPKTTESTPKAAAASSEEDASSKATTSSSRANTPRKTGNRDIIRHK